MSKKHDLSLAFAVQQSHKRMARPYEALAKGGKVKKADSNFKWGQSDDKKEAAKNKHFPETKDQHRDRIDRMYARRAEQRPKGVHTPNVMREPSYNEHGAGEGGVSHAGSYIKEPAHAYYNKEDWSPDYEKAKELHRQKLAELKAMPKPKLYAKGGHVKSPSKGHTIKQLAHLKSEGWRNGDTGLEMSEEEGEHHLNSMRQNKADKYVKKYFANQSDEDESDEPHLAKGGKVIPRSGDADAQKGINKPAGYYHREAREGTFRAKDDKGVSELGDIVRSAHYEDNPHIRREYFDHVKRAKREMLTDVKDQSRKRNPAKLRVLAKGGIVQGIIDKLKGKKK